MALARPRQGAWSVSVEPVGAVATLLDRLVAAAHGGPVAFGVDFPIGLPRAYVERHPSPAENFPAFLQTVAARPSFFDVADTLSEVCSGRPFYPNRGVKGMTRLSHAEALDLGDAAALYRACDRATASRPAGAPLFWTLGANQSGKAAISAWRDLLVPAFQSRPRVALWPFDGPLSALLASGTVAVAETYPAEALRQIGLRPIGSKRHQGDRLALVPGICAAMRGIGAVPTPAAAGLMRDGFGSDAAGEDRLDCMLGLLCLLQVICGKRADAIPADPWIRCWEGWVLGQAG